MADNAQIRAAFISLLAVLESQQRQLDESLERQLSMQDAAQQIMKEFAQKQEEAASLISNATQYRIAHKADSIAELRSVIGQMFLD